MGRLVVRIIALALALAGAFWAKSRLNGWLAEAPQGGVAEDVGTATDPSEPQEAEPAPDGSITVSTPASSDAAPAEPAADAPTGPVASRP